MKKIGVVFICALFIATQNKAQYIVNPVKPGFKRQNVFIGAMPEFGLSSNSLTLGLTGEAGYTFSPHIEAGLVLNFEYKHLNMDALRFGYFNPGIGVFGRLYPLRNLFFQVQPEYNLQTFKTYDPYSGNYLRDHYGAASLFTGIGLRKSLGKNNSIYLLSMYDLINDVKSPYQHNHPVFKVGLDFHLQASQKK